MPSAADKLEKEAVEWLELVSGEQFDSNKSFQENLKDGAILCKAFNGSFMDLKVKYAQSAMPFKQMENIATFLSALSKVQNFRSFDLFSTVDLYEGKNIPQVIRCILACKRFAEIEAKNKGIENLNKNEKLSTNNIEEKEIEENEIKEKEIEENEIEENEIEENEIEEKEIEEKEIEEKEIEEEEIEEEEIEEETPFELADEENDAEKNEEGPFESNQQPEVEQNIYNEKEEEEEQNIENNNNVEEEIIQPEVVLVENDDQELKENDQEEYETFTTENPGTFEIQVSN